MAGYADNIKKDLTRWVAEGLLTAELAQQLRADVETRYGRGFSFGYVLAMMAALMFCAALLILVAANWDAIPRIGRVVSLFALIAAGYVGGALLKQRGHGEYGEAAWLIAAASFGGAIALIGQMYHLSGDETQAILVWCVGTMIAAVLLRSALLTVASVGLAVTWFAYPVMSFNVDIPHYYLVLLAVLWAVAMWTQSAVARHAIILALIFYCVMIFIDNESPAVMIVLAAGSVAVLAAVALGGEKTEQITGLGTGLAVDALLGFLVAMFVLQFQFLDGAHFVWLAALTLAGIAGALHVAGRSSRGIRWLAYLGFAGEICLVYGATVGSMLGTAGFFLLAAAGIGLLAFVIIRVERRLSQPAASTGEPA